MQQLAPDRLLVTLRHDLDDKARDCLARLPVSDLLLSTCRHDWELFDDACTDGDARLAASPELRRKVRGLAIGFGEVRSWGLLTEFPRLAYLTIRGPALEHVDHRAALRLCELADLHYVDVLDAERPGAELDMLPLGCIMRWMTFQARRSADRMNTPESRLPHRPSRRRAICAAYSCGASTTSDGASSRPPVQASRSSTSWMGCGVASGVRARHRSRVIR